MHAADEVFGVGRDGFAQELGIGEDEIRRRQRARHLANVEGGLEARVLVDAVGLLGHLRRPGAGDEIELLHEIEELVLFPFGIDKPPVTRVGLDRGRCRLAHHALQRGRPEIEISGP